ncbi:transcription factor Adf-1 [Elysia marginata]|uniref:Transcription factor Adf-1 n=1 Tax=Elysia marginata TaxID=1093978 RepID=A0AAV4HFW7_9GAST|nr:transcription factor Adf-1 [Elysia marginata]
MSDNESQATVYSDDEGRSEDKTITLIRLVKERAFLYRKTDKRYSDRNLTERTWTQISTELGWTKEETRETWTKLRNNFAKKARL